MGAAKNRGPRELRVAESIAKQEAAALARRQHLAELEAALTPEQRTERKRAREKLTMLLGFTAGMLVS